MSHGLEVADPVVKLLSDRVGNDGVDQSEGDHHQGDQADQEPPDQVVRTKELHQVRLPGNPGTDDAHIVVTIVVDSKGKPDKSNVDLEVNSPT